jgi:hypothetical protein
VCVCVRERERERERGRERGREGGRERERKRERREQIDTSRNGDAILPPIFPLAAFFIWQLIGVEVARSS